MTLCHIKYSCTAQAHTRAHAAHSHMLVWYMERWGNTTHNKRTQRMMMTDSWLFVCRRWYSMYTLNIFIFEWPNGKGETIQLLKPLVSVCLSDFCSFVWLLFRTIASAFGCAQIAFSKKCIDKTSWNNSINGRTNCSGIWQSLTFSICPNHFDS